MPAFFISGIIGKWNIMKIIYTLYCCNLGTSMFKPCIFSICFLIICPAYRKYIFINLNTICSLLCKRLCITYACIKHIKIRHKHILVFI